MDIDKWTEEREQAHLYRQMAGQDEALDKFLKVAAGNRTLTVKSARLHAYFQSLAAYLKTAPYLLAWAEIIENYQMSQGKIQGSRDQYERAYIFKKEQEAMKPDLLPGGIK